MRIASADAATHFETIIGTSQNSLFSAGSCFVESQEKFSVDKGADDKAIPRRGDMRPLVHGNRFCTVPPLPRLSIGLNGDLKGSLSGKVIVSHRDLIAIFLIQDHVLIRVRIVAEIGRRIDPRLDGKNGAEVGIQAPVIGSLKVTLRIPFEFQCHLSGITELG
jgi:hypothetical protein